MDVEIEIDDIRVIEPADIIRAVNANSYLPRNFIGKCNSYVNPLGVMPGEAWLLLSRKDVESLNDSDAHTLTFKSDLNKPEQIQTVAGLYFDHALCMTPGDDDDDDSVYMAHFFDVRAILGLSDIGWDTGTGGPGFYNLGSGQRGNATVVGVFNVPHHYNTSSVLDGSTKEHRFFAASLKSASSAGAPYSIWTWQGALDELWTYLPAAYRGTSPTLPYTPLGVPINLEYSGLSVMKSIEHLLGLIYCSLSYDPATATFSVVKLGTTQSGLTDLFVEPQREGRIVFDYMPIESTKNKHPRKITSLLHSFKCGYFSEPTYRSQTHIGSLTAPGDGPFYSNAHAVGPIQNFGSTVGAFDDTGRIVHTDILAGVNENGVTITSYGSSDSIYNESNERVASYSQKIRTSDTFDGKTIAGVVKIPTGSQVKLVRWRDYGNGHGLVTEYYRFPNLPKQKHISGNPIEASYSDLTLGEEVGKRDTRHHRFENINDAGSVQIFMAKLEDLLPLAITTGKPWTWRGNFTTGSYADVALGLDQEFELLDWLRDSSEGVGNYTFPSLSGKKAIVAWVRDSDTYVVLNWEKPYTRHADQAVVTFGNTNGEISGLTIGSSYSQAEVQSLRDKTEELADDVRAVGVLVHALRTAMIAYGIIKGAA